MFRDNSAYVSAIRVCPLFDETELVTRKDLQIELAPIHADLNLLKWMILNPAVDRVEGGTACGPIPQRSRRKQTLLRRGQLRDLVSMESRSVNPIKQLTPGLLNELDSGLQPPDKQGLSRCFLAA